MRERQPIPRRKYMGKQVSGPPLTQAEHFWNCEACGGWFDMRDLAGDPADSVFYIQEGSVKVYVACRLCFWTIGQCSYCARGTPARSLYRLNPIGTSSQSSPNLRGE